MSINFSSSYTAWKDYAFDSFKKAVTRTPVTTTTDNRTDQEILTEGTAATIYAIFYRQEDVTDKAKQGFLQNADAIIQVLPDQALNRNDKITYQGENYRVIKSPTTRRLGTQAFYKVGQCVKI